MGSQCSVKTHSMKCFKNNKEIKHLASKHLEILDTLTNQIQAINE